LEGGRKDEVAKWDRFCLLVGNLSQTSPYNFDIMIRTVLVNNRYCFNAVNMGLMETFDVKGNQYDTLGHLWYALALDMPNYDGLSKLSGDANLYFFEAAKDSKESMSHCFKNGNFWALREMYNYDRLIGNNIFQLTQ
jgi:hypothetical protein